jgi:hypothetical protein
MTTIEKISQQTGNLPETYQMEVLDFVEYLTIKTNKKVGVSLLEEQEWSKFSLSGNGRVRG